MNNDLIPVNIHYENSNSNEPIYIRPTLRRLSASRNLTKKSPSLNMETIRPFYLGQKGNIKKNITHKKQATRHNKNSVNMQQFVKYLAHMPENQHNKIMMNFFNSRKHNNRSRRHNNRK